MKHGFFAGALVAALTACGAPPPSTDVRWDCPVGWVAAASSGCGPAVLLCGDDAAPAAEGACAAIETPADAPFRRDLANGAAINGAWPADEAWAPSAGIDACPEGWTRGADGTCDPQLRTDCPAGTAALPGARCTDTGESSCAAGTFVAREALGPDAQAPGARLVYVRAGAAPDGDGSETRPFATLGEGLRAVGTSGWVLVSAGIFRESISITAGSVHLVGVCAARTTLEALVGSAGVKVEGAGTSLELRGMRIAGGDPGVLARMGAQLTARAVRVEGAVDTGITVVHAGTRATLLDVLVRGTNPARDGSGGMGLAVLEARVTATRLALDENRTFGVFTAVAGTEVSLTDVAIRATQARPRSTAMGISAGERSQVTVTRGVIARNTGAGVYATQGARVELADTVVRDQQLRDTGEDGMGLYVDQGGALRVTRTLIENNRTFGVFAFGAGTTLALDRSIVRATQLDGSGNDGAGLTVSSAARATVTRAVFEQNHTVGVRVSAEGAALELADSIVRATQPRRDGSFGRGIGADNAATLTATRVLVQGNHEVGLIAAEPGATVTLLDSIVRDTAPAAGAQGSGLAAQGGAQLAARRTLVARNTEAGVLAFHPGTTLSLDDCAVRATRPRADGTFGRGIAASDGAALTARRTLVDAHTEAAVTAFGAGTLATLEDLLVRDVRPSVSGFGAGALAFAGARIEGTRVALSQVAGIGLGAVASSGDAQAQLSVADTYVYDVARSPILVRARDGVDRAEGPAVAYGLYASTGSSLRAVRALVARGGYGFFNDGGSLSARGAVFTGQLDAAGASNGAETNLVLEQVSRRGNTVDEVLRDVSLPGSTALAAPTPICPLEGCP